MGEPSFQQQVATLNATLNVIEESLAREENAPVEGLGDFKSGPDDVRRSPDWRSERTSPRTRRAQSRRRRTDAEHRAGTAIRTLTKHGSLTWRCNVEA